MMNAGDSKSTKRKPSTGEALRRAALLLKEAGVGEPDLEAELMLRHITGLKRHELYMERGRRLEAKEAALLEKFLWRRKKREPLAYITGEVEFRGLSLKTTKDVLIPRPETELIVDEALKVLRNRPSPLIIDLCTGSGCIAVALAVELEAKGQDVTLYAADTSGAALGVAAFNARRHGVEGRIKFLQGDLFSPLEALRPAADLIVSNPPYVAEEDMAELQPEVRDYEPRGALSGGPGGLGVIKRIISGAPLYLRDGGYIVMEMGLGQAGAVMDLARARGFGNVEIKRDTCGVERILIARKR